MEGKTQQQQKRKREKEPKQPKSQIPGGELCVLYVLVESMKALQKNQGRTDQMLGAMADILTSLAIPSQQWVSGGSCFYSVHSVKG